MAKYFYIINSAPNENTTFIPKTFIRVERGDRISWLDEIGAYLHNKTGDPFSPMLLAKGRNLKIHQVTLDTP